jgi:threonine synthase
MSKLVCRSCNKEYSLNDVIWRCSCGGLLDIDFESFFPIEKIKKRPPTLWRYREAIPIDNNINIISFNEGFTPLIPLDFDNKKVMIKLDYLFPSGSFKDRGATVLVSKMKELGIRKVVEDSSGNAGSAIACYCAKAGIEIDVFVPSYTPYGKIAQIESYGANLNKIPGTRDDTAKAALKKAENTYYASHYWNPFFFQGTKTFAFEVTEQLDWRVPDSVILPVGSGSLLLGLFTGFNELLNSKIINRIPRLIGIQAENCAPLAFAFEKNLNEIPKIERKETIAEGISISEPIRGKQILDIVKKSNGKFIMVSESEIKDALRWITKKGFLIEPTSVVVISGIKKYLNEISKDEIIVSLFTGHGLKEVEKIYNLLKNI